MKLPGFTAEHSLDRTNEKYQMAGNSAEETGAIRPADHCSDCVAYCRTLSGFLEAACMTGCATVCPNLNV
jgi:hypothetical protein